MPQTPIFQSRYLCNRNRKNVNLWHFKLRLFNVTELIVWNSKGLRHRDTKIWVCGKNLDPVYFVGNLSKFQSIILINVWYKSGSIFSILCRSADSFYSTSISSHSHICRDDFNWGILNFKVPNLDIKIRCSRLTIIHTTWFRSLDTISFLNCIKIIIANPSMIWLLSNSLITKWFLENENNIWLQWRYYFFHSPPPIKKIARFYKLKGIESLPEFEISNIHNGRLQRLKQLYLWQNLNSFVSFNYDIYNIHVYI